MKKAFTLIELLVVIAIIAILAAILFPVFAQAKKSAKSTASMAHVKQIGTAQHIYAGDFDDGTVITDTAWFGRPRWQELLLPYTKNRDLFWDPSRKIQSGDKVRGYDWDEVTTFAINDSGYSGAWLRSGGCNSGDWNYVYGRKLSAMENISERASFVPVVWGGTDIGWYYFRAYESNWIDPTDTRGTWSWYNMIWDTRDFFTGNSMPVVKADGSAGKFKRGNFVDWNQAPGTAEYCAWYEKDGHRWWGPYWNQN
ncbi:MAG: prepilin-type N-terminal cleavage/methylation domain-containing protein [Fimbriimonas sp.]